MEGKYLVNSKENESLQQTTEYGAVNPVCEEANGRECDTNIKRIETSFETKVREKSRSCSCTVEIGDCDCGKKKILLEPWAKHKTVAMVAGLSLFGIWMIVIVLVGQTGKL